MQNIAQRPTAQLELQFPCVTQSEHVAIAQLGVHISAPHNAAEPPAPAPELPEAPLLPPVAPEVVALPVEPLAPPVAPEVVAPPVVPEMPPPYPVDWAPPLAEAPPAPAGKPPRPPAETSISS